MNSVTLSFKDIPSAWQRARAKRLFLYERQNWRDSMEILKLALNGRFEFERLSAKQEVLRGVTNFPLSWLSLPTLVYYRGIASREVRIQDIPSEFLAEKGCLKIFVSSSFVERATWVKLRRANVFVFVLNLTYKKVRSDFRGYLWRLMRKGEKIATNPLEFFNRVKFKLDDRKQRTKILTWFFRVLHGFPAAYKLWREVDRMVRLSLQGAISPYNLELLALQREFSLLRLKTGFGPPASEPLQG